MKHDQLVAQEAEEAFAGLMQNKESPEKYMFFISLLQDVAIEIDLTF